MPPPPWKLPGYVVEELLGRGGSGEVWRARIARSGEAVALKRLPIAEPGQVAAARVEAAVLSALDHPHLIRLHELVRTSDAVVLVLDLAAAGSLADLLGRRTRLTPGEVVTALAPIGAALAYAHAEGIVHGDVSAANVLFSSIGLPLLGDLGVARIIGDDGPVRSTPAYVDPMVASGHLPGTPTDVFGLAAVAVHALSGRPLWSGATAAEMVAQATAAASSGRPIDLAALLPELPESMREVLGRALVAQPQLRSTAAEFALDLRHSLAPTPVELRAGREPGRPGFERPAGQLTYGVRLPPLRRDSPPPRRHRAEPAASATRAGRPRAGRRWRALIVALSLAAMVAIAALVVARPAHRADGVAAAATAAVAMVSSVAAPTSSSATVPGGSGAAGPPVITDAASATVVLAGLDQVRERAFAERDPALLAQVYGPGDLLAADEAAVAHAVPAGCILRGVHTDYRDVRIVATVAGSSDLLATATLTPSILSCAGPAETTVPGVPATNLRIELVRGAGGRYLITAQLVV